MKVSEIINSFTGSKMISKTTLYSHIRVNHDVDQETYEEIKKRWHNGRWHYKKMLIVEDIMFHLGVSRSTVYRLLKEHKIRSIKINKRYFISKEDFKNFINQTGGGKYDS